MLREGGHTHTLRVWHAKCAISGFVRESVRRDSGEATLDRGERAAGGGCIAATLGRRASVAATASRKRRTPHRGRRPEQGVSLNSLPATGTTPGRRVLHPSNPMNTTCQPAGEREVGEDRPRDAASRGTVQPGRAGVPGRCAAAYGPLAAPLRLTTPGFGVTNGRPRAWSGREPYVEPGTSLVTPRPPRRTGGRVVSKSMVNSRPHARP